MVDKIIEVATPQVAETQRRFEQNKENASVLELQAQIAERSEAFITL